MTSKTLAEGRDPFVVMSWTARSWESSEPTGYIYETSGDLLAVDDGGDEALAGKFRIYYVDVDRARDEGFPVFDVFDSYAETSSYYHALFDDDNSSDFGDSPKFSDRVMKVTNNALTGSNVLILDRLELLPQYRGRGLGLGIMRQMIKRFGAGARVVVIKPFPLQFEREPEDEDSRKWCAELGLSQLNRNELVATKKLKAYYARLGFVRVNRTPFMVRAAQF